MAFAEPAGMLRVEVAYRPKDGPADVVSLELSSGSTLLHALRASGMLERHAEIDPSRHRVGVWGRIKPLGEPLRDGDRVEIYRELTVDPKEARRLRYRKHREAGPGSRARTGVGKVAGAMSAGGSGEEAD